MEITDQYVLQQRWQQAYLAAYQVEAERALQRFIDGERDQRFLWQVLQLVQTFCSLATSEHQVEGSAVAIARLAGATCAHISGHGYWSEIAALWPKLIAALPRRRAPALYVELVKQLALLHSVQGDSQEAGDLYTQLVRDPLFADVPHGLQVDVLHQFGTLLVWRGNLNEAEMLLHQVLSLAISTPDSSAQRNEVDQFGVRATFIETPTWESEAYALNQLGNIAMFRGAFTRAEQLYNRCWNVLKNHGEEENLACVAHQALGRLFTHWRRPQTAVAILEQGLTIRRRRQAQEGTAINLMYLAAAHLQLHEVTQAECLLTEALPLLKRIGDRRDIGLCHMYLGELERQRKARATCVDHWRQALIYLKTVHTPLIEQHLFLRLGLWLLIAGEFHLFHQIMHQLSRSIQEQKLTPYQLYQVIVLSFRETQG